MSETTVEDFLFQKIDYLVTCPFCAVGCRFKFLKGRDEVVFSARTLHEIDYDYGNLLSGGALCPRGHFAYELLSHPKRLGESFYRTNGKWQQEIPELIFQHLAQEMARSSHPYPLAMMLDPLLSIHDLRSMLDLARNLNLTAVDVVAPRDRHLFRALLDLPEQAQRLTDPRKISQTSVIFCLGDVFSKQPVLSKHILKAKYALRTHRLLHINPLPTRTSWFANIFVQNLPHTEPLILAQIFLNLLQEVAAEQVTETHQAVAEILQSTLSHDIPRFLGSRELTSLSRMSQLLRQNPGAILFYSTHLYNAATSYLNAILCSLISQMVQGYFVPLYTDSNLEALEVLSREVYPELQLGKRNLLPHILQGEFAYVWAAGWNPDRLFPGALAWPEATRWILTSLVQMEPEIPVAALLPLAHPLEQPDLRLNFLPHQFIGSEPVMPPLGGSQPLSLYALLFHQKLMNTGVSFSSPESGYINQPFPALFAQEVDYYRSKLEELYTGNPQHWFIPTDHVAHYRDGALTQYSSWAQKDCDDENVDVSEHLARSLQLRKGQAVQIAVDSPKAGKSSRTLFSSETVLMANPRPSLPEHLIVPFAHVPSVRKLLAGELAPHNREYYFWCPPVQISPI